MKRIVATGRKPAIDFQKILHPGDLCRDNDAIMAKSHLFGDGG